MEYNFKTDTQKTPKKEFLSKVSGVFICALFLTGICSLGGICYIIRGIAEKVWQENGMADFAWRSMFYLVIISAFISLVKIAVDEKPFSRTLTYCVRAMAGIFLIASLLIPRLSGYQSSGFEIFSKGSFVLIDGGILLPGLLLLLLSCLIKEGFDMQREINEIL